MYQRILIGFDGSDAAHDAIALGRQVALMTDAAVRVVNVYPYQPVGRAANPALARVLHDEADRVMTDAREAFADRPGTRFLLVPSTSPPRALQHIAEKWPADLVVIGSSHHARVGQVVVGRAGEHALHGAPCPVLIAPAGFRNIAAPPRRIGAGFHGSEDSSAALAEAAALAREAGAELVVLDVVDVGSGYSPVEWSLIGFPEYREELRRVAQEDVEDALAELGIGATVEVEVGDAEEALLRHSRDLDLLVIGSRGYGPLRRVLLGSVSSRLTRGAHCPLLILPRAADAAAHTEHADRMEVMA